MTSIGSIEPPLIRSMRASDAEAVAALHAANWRANYGGLLTASYLADEVGRERAAVWTARLDRASDREFGLVAEVDGALIGFAYVVGGSDPVYGNLLDNIHVDAKAQGKGIGRLLLGRVADGLSARDWGAGLYLWVYAANAGARRLYQRLGASEQGREMMVSADGGRVLACRYVWSDASRLVV